MLSKTKTLQSVKAGGGILDGTRKGFDAVMRTIRNFPGIVVMTISAKKGVTAELDEVYTKAIVADTEDGKRYVREKLRYLLSKHSEIVWPLLHEQGLGISVTRTAMFASRRLCDDMEREASELIESIFKYGDIDLAKKAELQSFGERLNTGLMRIYLNAQGYLTIHFDARKFVHAVPGPEGLFTGAIVDHEATIKALAEQIKCVMASLPAPSSFKGIVCLIEGFISVCYGKVATLGYDGSDLTGCFVAEAIKLAGFSDTATVELLKNLDRPLWPCSLPKLREKLLKEKQGRLVGLQAMDYAIRNLVTIIVRDVVSGIGYRFGPRSFGWVTKVQKLSD